MTVSAGLERLGWSDRWEALFAPYGEQGLLPARVVRADRGMVMADTGEGIVRAESSALLRKGNLDPTELPAVGDWVAVETMEGDGNAIIHGVLDRTSAFVRGNADGTSAGQVVGANIDTVFVVHAVADEPNLRRIERELAMAWESGAMPVVVLTKADLADDPEDAVAPVEAVAPGVDVFLTAALQGTGMGPLAEYARHGRTVALIGPSGAGKSTIVNALVGEERMATGEVRAGDQKGRHTTVTRELISLAEGGMLLDTPGMRALAVHDLSDGIDAAFPEITALAAGCRFADCTHESEPGCAVLEAVEAGEIPAERVESYRKLRREAGVAAAKSDARLKVERERRSRDIAKSVKRFYKDSDKRRGGG